LGSAAAARHSAAHAAPNARGLLSTLGGPALAPALLLLLELALLSVT
jgi:hypothetical protein